MTPRSIAFGGWCVGVVLLAVGCGPGTRADPTAPPPSSTPAITPVEPPVDVPAPAATSVPSDAAPAATAPPTADPNAVHARASLGAPVVALIEGATRVEVGHLRTGAAAEAERETLRTPDRIVGYRIRGRLRTLADDRARELIAQVLDDASYSPVLARCANQSWLGARFSSGAGVVELAVGLPCNQAVWAANLAGGNVRWGATMQPGAAQAVQALVDGP